MIMKVRIIICSFALVLIALVMYALLSSSFSDNPRILNISEFSPYSLVLVIELPMLRNLKILN